MENKKQRKAGFGTVLSFSFWQTVKSRSFIITACIFFLVSFLSLPVYTLIQGKNASDNTGESAKLQTLYVMDHAEGRFVKGLQKVFSTDAYFANTKLKPVSAKKEADQALEHATNAAFLDITFAEGHCEFAYTSPDQTGLQMMDFADKIEESYKKIVLSGFDVDKKAMKMINADIHSKIDDSLQTKGQEAGNDQTDALAEGQVQFGQGVYIGSFILIMVVIFLVSMGGEAVASSVVTEKASKVIEYLLTSVKPITILTGKVIAMLLTVFLQLGILLAGLIGSMCLAGAMTGQKWTQVLPAGMHEMVAFSNGTILEAVARLGIAILVFLAGVLFFGWIAGVSGACVSKLDELAEAVKGYSILMIIGAYFAIYVISQASMGGVSQILVNVGAVIPVSGVFLTPVLLIAGQIPLWIGVVAFAVIVIFDILLARFAASVYDYLVYYNGEKIKWKKLLQIAGRKNKRLKA